jgi:hypothetical protein
MSSGTVTAEAADAAEEPPYRSYEPADYRPSDHFIERYSPTTGRLSKTQTDPPITGEVISTCIRRGECREARGPNRYRLVADVDGTEWHLLVALHESDGRCHDVLTAYAPKYHNPDANPSGGHCR